MASPPVSRNDPPPAPGALGVVLPPRVILDYLSAAMRWRDQLKSDLALLDQRAQRAQAAVALTADVTLAYALVNAVSTRLDEIVATWDSGRVGSKECERISQLVWGRLDGGVGLGMAVSYVEACVLAAAIIDRLRERVDADALAGGIGERIGNLRGQIERLRTMALEAGDPQQAVDQLELDLGDVVAAFDRGEEIEALLARLEQVAALAERDAIIAGARQRTLARDIASLHQRLAAVKEREAEARRDEERCAEKIANPPRLAVPSVATLGSVPADRVAVDQFAARLAQVERAVSEAARRFAAPLAERDDLRGLLQSYQAMAAGRGHAEDVTLHDAYVRAHDVLWSAPCDLAEARSRVEQYQRLVRAATDPLAPRRDVVAPPEVASPAAPATSADGTPPASPASRMETF